MHASCAWSVRPDLMASTSLSAGQLEWLVQHNKHQLSPNLWRINFWTMKSTSAAAATSAAYYRTVYLHLVWMQPCRESRLSILSPCGRGHRCSLCRPEGPLPPGSGRLTRFWWGRRRCTSDVLLPTRSASVPGEQLGQGASKHQQAAAAADGEWRRRRRRVRMGSGGENGRET